MNVKSVCAAAPYYNTLLPLSIPLTPKKYYFYQIFRDFLSCFYVFGIFLCYLQLVAMPCMLVPCFELFSIS